ncbi:uncharacterized protein LOC143297951 [Babylonia areolata]|uniref:uncharacterized protein LOC143297951 n=1 Tax=Babylonia areolata TaxID=304850 RepID=UPI003FCEEC1D
MAEEQAELPTEDHEMEEEKETSEKDDESEEEESDDGEYFEVEKIMSRKKRDGIFLYRVRWKGYPPSNDTWEPVDNLDVVRDMVEEFDAREEQKAKARQEERRLRKLRMEGKKLPGEESSDSSNSSDDERLLSEDTKFFKMLEKNKDFVFGQPDLYSKVKSRAATLASKKKMEESQKEASAAPSKTAEGKEGNRVRGRGKAKEKPQPVKTSTRNRRTKRAVSEDSEQESDESPAPKKSGRGKGRIKKAANSEGDEDSEDSASGEKGRGRSRKRKKKETSEEDADSDDSASLGKGKGQVRPGKKAVIEDSEENETDSDVAPLRSVGKQKKKFRIESSEENGSDSSLINKKRSKPLSLSDRKQTARKLASSKKTSVGQKSPIGEKGSEKSSSDSEDDQPLSAKCEKALVTSDTPVSLSPAAAEDQEEETQLETNSPKQSSDSSTDSLSKSGSVRASPKLSPAQPRMIVPVLEKLALSSQFEEPKEETKVSVRDDKTAPSSHWNKAADEKKTALQRGTSKVESMDTDTPHKKDEWKESKKKSSSSRKRKQDTAAEHSRAVNEGEASPVKTSPPRPHSPYEDQSTLGESDPPVLSKEPKTAEVMGEDSAANALPPVLQKSGQEKKVPPLRITVPKLKLEPQKLKPESPKPYHHHHSPKSQSQSACGKLEKVKLKEGMKAGKHDHHASGSVLKSSTTSKRPPSRENVPESALMVTVSSSASVSASTTSSVTKKDQTSRSVTGTSVSHHQSVTSKPDLSLKFGRTLAMESASLKLESVSSRAPKPESMDRSGRTDHTDPKTSRTDSLESRRRYSSSSEFSSSVTGSRDSICGPYAPNSAKDLPSPSRDSLLIPSSRTTSGVLSSASTSRETSSLYSSIRDSSLMARGMGFTSVSGRDLTHTSSSLYKDSHFTSGSSRDSHLISGSSRDFHSGSGSPGDVRLGAGYIHLSSGSSRESSFTSSRDFHAPRGGDAKDSSAGSSRHNLTSSIFGKENADRQHGFKSLSSLPKKGDSVQPLDTILNSSLYDGDKSRQYKGLDSDFDLALQRIDLEYLEKLLLPPVTPMELSDEELRQAVIDGNCYLVERALACSKPYNLDLPDNKGYTLLMNAVLRGSDDIIVHLLSRGADAQVQVNGVTALLLAVEHAESSTVFMLLEMGAHVNAVDVNGETSLFKAVRRGDKQILKLLLDHGANFSLLSRLGLSPLQMAKQFRLADIETTLIDHIHKVVRSFEEQVNLTVRGTAKLVSCLFPHHCMPLYESDTINIPFKYQPSMPSGPGMGCLLFIAHARFNPQDVKCRLYGQCAVERVTLNGVLQPCLTEESNFVLMCHPLITGWNELVIHTKKDPMSKAKLIVCAYKAQLIYK